MVVDDDFVFFEIMLCMFEKLKYRGKILLLNIVCYLFFCMFIDI